MNDDKEVRAFIQEHRMTTATAYDDLMQLLSRARDLPSRDAERGTAEVAEAKLMRAAEGFQRIAGMCNVEGHCACGRPNGVPAVQHAALTALHDISPAKMCGKYLGDNDGTCPQLTCIRDRDHEGNCDNALGDEPKLRGTGIPRIPDGPGVRHNIYPAKK